jgi:hypothetical protein
MKALPARLLLIIGVALFFGCSIAPKHTANYQHNSIDFSGFEDRRNWMDYPKIHEF